MRFRIAILMLLPVLMTAPAMAGTIQINQTREEEPNDLPSQANQLNDDTGAYLCAFVQAGDDDFYEFTTNVPNTVLSVEAKGAPYVTDTFLTILDSDLNTLAFHDDQSDLNRDAKISNLPLPEPGVYYIYVSESTGNSGVGYTYSLVGQLVEPEIVDVDAPTYSGAAGAISATRTDPTTVKLTWNQAADDISLAADIRYNIYYGASPAAVFSSAPMTTVNGVLSATLDDISNSQSYYFGVRAEDEADNEEGNTVVVEAAPLTAASPAGWMDYE